MSEKTLKFNNIRLNKKEFLKSKQPIDLISVSTDYILTSDKFKHSDEGFKYFICYQEGEIVKRLCIILPQMSGCIKYFENGGKIMSFMVKCYFEEYKQKLPVELARHLRGNVLLQCTVYELLISNILNNRVYVLDKCNKIWDKIKEKLNMP